MCKVVERVFTARFQQQHRIDVRLPYNVRDAATRPMQNWEHRSFNLKWRVWRLSYWVSDEMLFEDIAFLRRIQPPDIVAFKPAVSNGGNLDAGGINPEMVGDLFNCCGKVSGQG